MKAKKASGKQEQFLMVGLAEQLDPRQAMYRLAHEIPWEDFEEEFGQFYSEEGRPAKAIRLMVGLLILKQLHNLGDETVVAQWVQNPYWQYFCGEKEFQWAMPVEPSDLVHFRHRIGEAGVQMILAVSISLHGRKALEKEVVIDTTVQEKNITYPTDSKLYRKVIERCWKAADREGVRLRRRYRKEVKKCLLAQRGWRQKNGLKRARRAVRKLRTIGGRLVRELKRKLNDKGLSRYREDLELFNRVLNQQRHDRHKIYSLHEPQVYCLSKGKEHKKYEFGAKASVVMTKTDGIIVGAESIETNVYDGATLPRVLEQVEALIGRRPQRAIVDRGYRGRTQVGETDILVPQARHQGLSEYQRRQMKKRFRRRAAIEPVIGHLKSDFRLARNYLKGSVGDSLNLMLAAAAWNFRKWMRQVVTLWPQLLRLLYPSHLSSLNHP